MPTNEITPGELAFQTQLKRVRKQAQSASMQLWDRQASFYERDIPAFVEQLIPTVAGAQRVAIEMTGAFLIQAAGFAINQLIPVNPDDIIPTLRNGADPSDVYTRAFRTVWKNLGNKVPLPIAIQRGGNRLANIVGMNVSLAFQATPPAFAKLNNPVLEKRGGKVIIGYSRTSEPGCCDFCSIVDGAFCYSEDPLPLHNNCGCTLSPVMGSQSTFDKMQDKREDSKDQWLFENEQGEWVPSNFQNEKNYVLVEHGELGPYLSSKRGDSE